MRQELRTGQYFITINCNFLFFFSEHRLSGDGAVCVAGLRDLLDGGRLLLRRAWLHDQEDGRGLRLRHGDIRGLPRLHEALRGVHDHQAVHSRHRGTLLRCLLCQVGFR